MFYLILFLVLVFCCCLEFLKVDKLYQYIGYLGASILLWLVAGLRYETGGDWTAYTVAFNSFEPLGLVLRNQAPNYTDSYMEPGFKLINALVKSLNGNVQLVFFIVASINACLLFFTLRKYLHYPTIGLILYFGSLYFNMDMVAIRQCTAVLFFFKSLEYVYERKLWKFFLTIILAAMFHRSALLLLPLYFILPLKPAKSSYLLIFLFCLLVYMANIEWIKPILLRIAGFIGGGNGAIIENYVTSPIYGVGRVLSVGLLINIMLFILFYLNFNQLKRLKFFYVFFNLFIINIFVYFVCFELLELANRLRYYFLLSNLFLLPSIIILYGDVYRRSIAFAFCIVFSFFYARNILLEMPTGIAYNPYQNYLIHELFDLESDGRQRLDKSNEELIKGRGN